jgi:hypothetical protein
LFCSQLGISKSRPPHVPRLAVLCWLEPKPRANCGSYRLDRHQVYAFDLGAVHGEGVNLAQVPTVSEWAPRICDAGLEADTTIADVPGLALNANQLTSLVQG